VSEGVKTIEGSSKIIVGDIQLIQVYINLKRVSILELNNLQHKVCISLFTESGQVLFCFFLYCVSYCSSGSARCLTLIS